MQPPSKPPKRQQPVLPPRPRSKRPPATPSRPPIKVRETALGIVQILFPLLTEPEQEAVLTMVRAIAQPRQH